MTTINNSTINPLEFHGFQKFGNWHEYYPEQDFYSTSSAACNYIELVMRKDFLYAFCVNSKVKYIGSSKKTVGKTLFVDWARNMKNPGLDKFSAGKSLLFNSLENKDEVEIWLLFPEIGFENLYVKPLLLDLSSTKIIRASKIGFLKEVKKNLIKNFRTKNECQWNKPPLLG